MNRSRSPAASEEGWQFVVSGQSEDEGSERSMPASRPQTPAVSLMADHSCPPTPESERLADTVLCAPFGPGGALPAPGSHSSRAGASGQRANSSVEAAGAEVVSLHCLQGLSQEGPLEGFALERALVTDTASPASEMAGAPEAHEATEEAEESVEAVGTEDEEVTDTDAAVGWQGLDGTHLAGMDALVELLEGLGWTSGVVVDACRAGMLGAQQAIHIVQQTTAQGAAMARQGAQAKLAQLLAFAGKLQGGGNPATGLLVSALSLTTLATLAGLVFFMSRCRNLSNTLAQRDREYMRLVQKVLNLQAALTQPLAGPVLRHTSTGWVSGLVASSLM